MSSYYAMTDIERIGPVGCVKHMNELHDTNSKLQDELDASLRREESWSSVLLSVRELWVMWKEHEYHPLAGSPEDDVMQAYDRAALLYPND